MNKEHAACNVCWFTGTWKWSRVGIRELGRARTSNSSQCCKALRTEELDSSHRRHVYKTFSKVRWFAGMWKWLLGGRRRR